MLTVGIARVSISQTLPPSPSLRLTDPQLMLPIPLVLPFEECYMNGITQCLPFGDLLFPPSNNGPEISHGLLGVPTFCSFLLLCSVRCHGRIKAHLATRLLKDIWVVSRFWLQWIKLLWASVYKSLPSSLPLLLPSAVASVRCNSHAAGSNYLWCMIRWFLVYSELWVITMTAENFHQLRKKPQVL